MLNKISASVKLYLLVFIMAVFIIGIGLYGIREINRMSRATETIYADRVLPLQQLTNVRFFFSVGILNSAQQAKDREITCSEAHKQIQDAREAIDTNWKTYRLTYLTAEEKDLSEQVSVLMNQSTTSIEKLMTILDKEDTEALAVVVKQELSPLVNSITAKVNALVSLQVQVSAKVNENSVADYNSALTKFILLIVFSLVLAIPFSYYLASSVKKLIQDLHESNTKIKATEEKYRTFIKYAGDSIFILNETLLITDVNDSACSLLNYSREELLKKKMPDVMDEEGRQGLLTRLELIRRDGGSLHERKLIRKDGSTIDTEVSVRALEGVGFISIIRNMTERIKANSAIRESEEKYRYLFENNPACIIIWDLENCSVMEVNNAVVEKYGYAKEEWVNMSVLQYRPKEDHENIKAFATKMLDGDEQITRTTWQHLKKNGEAMQMEISSHKISYNNRKAILSIGLDVTEQLKVEAALNKSEENFRSLVDHAADAIFMVADDGIIFDVNRSASELLQYSKEELIGKTVLDLHPSVEHTKVFQIWDKLRKSRALTDERWLQRKDGTLVEVEISRKMLPDSSGAIAIVRDITERKKIEKALEQSEERNRALIENISDTIILINEKLEVFYQSPAFIRTAGLTLEELKDRTVFDFIHPDDLQSFRDTIQQTLASPGVILQNQYRILHKQGHYIWVEGTIMNLLDNESVKAFVATYRDITQRKKVEEHRDQLLTDLTHRYNELMQFNYIVSHNLRAPIANIIGLTHLFTLQDDMAEKTKTIKFIMDTTKRMDEVIRDLNNILALQTPINEKKEIIQLKNIIHAITETLHTQINTSEITINISITPDANSFLSIKAYFESILYNLINNAIKFRSPKRKPFLNIEAAKRGDDLIVTVEDNGIGIDLELHRDRIFGLYSRFNSETEGKGLGLYMTKLQVESLGGKIEIKSRPNEGSAFTITLKTN